MTTLDLLRRLWAWAWWRTTSSIHYRRCDSNRMFFTGGGVLMRCGDDGLFCSAQCGMRAEPSS